MRVFKSERRCVAAATAAAAAFFYGCDLMVGLCFAPVNDAVKLIIAWL